MNISLSASVEDLIIRSFYSKGSPLKRQKAYAYGLQSPLWFWSFCGSYKNQIDIQNTIEKEQLRVVNLMRWLLLSKGKDVSIAIVVPLQWQTLMKTKITDLFSEIRSAKTVARGEEEDGGEVGKLSITKDNLEHIEVLAHHELSIRKRKQQQQSGMPQLPSLPSTKTDTDTCKGSPKIRFDVILYTFGFPPCLENLNLVISQEQNLRDAVQASECSFILSADIGWTSSFVFSKWREWKVFMSKLKDEPLPISMEISPEEHNSESSSVSEKDRIPHLVGKSIPVCCSAHPNQRKIYYGTTPIIFQCPRFCLQSFACGEPNHMCMELCHISLLSGISHSANQCMYRCDKIMSPCGHRCLKKCSSPCDCFQLVEVPLSCFHEVPLGLDKETGETVYGRVDHVYKGTCANASSPCHVEFASECAACAGPIQVFCNEALEMQHTLVHKTIICDSCHRWTRELRAEILGSLLCEVEQKRKRIRVEVVQSHHEQQKAAKHGLFLPGDRVEIVDSTKCVAPLFTDDFPHIKFLSMEEPDFFTKTQGAYGTFVSTHVDMIDVTQLRHLIQMPTGLHILITDGGLKVIRHAARALIENMKRYYLCDGANNESMGRIEGVPTSSTLRIEDARSDKTLKEGSCVDGESVRSFLKSYSGKSLYIPAPISALLSVESGEEKIFSNCFATILGPGPNLHEESSMVMVEVSTYTPLSLVSDAQKTTMNLLCLSKDQEEKDKNRNCEEEGKEGKETDIGANPQKIDTVCPCMHVDLLPDGPLCNVSYTFFADVAHLEPTDGYEKNQYVYVIRPEHQVRDTYALHLITVASRREFQNNDLVISSSRLQVDTPYTVLGLLNPPSLGEGYRALDPLVILAKSFSARDSREKMSTMNDFRTGMTRERQTKRRFPERKNYTDMGNSILYFAIPFMFTKCDEETKWESALDASSHKIFEARYEAAKKSKIEDLCLQNEERAFRKLEQLPPVTEEMKTQLRKSYSIPVPIPSDKDLASIHQKYLSMGTLSPNQFKALQIRDAIERKKEQRMRGGGWTEDVLRRIALDNAADASHVRSLEVEVSEKSYKKQ